MKHLKKFENFDKPMEMTTNYPSVENMKAYVCGCGYNEMECDAMSYKELCVCYDKCKMEMNEAKKTRKVSYKKSGLKEPKKADLDKDGKLGEWELARGKAIQKAMAKKK